MDVQRDICTYLEPQTVTGFGLLLHRVDLQAFFLEAGLGVSVWCAKEVINDFLFLDWEGVEVDVFQVLDLARLDQTSELGAWGPHFFVSVATTPSSSATPSSATTSTVTSSSATVSTPTTAAEGGGTNENEFGIDYR